MLNLTWQSTIPQFANFQSKIENYDTLHQLEAYRLQPRLENTLNRFLSVSSFPPFLVLCAADEQLHHLQLKQQLQKIAPTTPVLHAQTFDEKSLFGIFYPRSKFHDSTQQLGLLHHAKDGVLILSLTQLLEQADLWQRLKNTIISQSLEWKSANSHRYEEMPAALECNVKLILLGSRESISFLEELEPDIHHLSLFAEYEQDIHLTTDNIDSYLSVVKGFEQQFATKPLSTAALHRLMQAGVRFTEDQQRLPLCPIWFRGLLVEASYQTSGNFIEASDIEDALSARYYRVAYLPERALDDIVRGQIVIDTQGEKIGQVNGLTLLSVPGHPLAYGEPARISCVVHAGDGEIVDVERKAELGGNIHAKGMMIMQAFITSALNLKEALPYSASMVFEQSYCEVDGDSASLAELCAFISALSMQPIKQQIAITGSVDQFGRVQAVGGINEKIEGFFYLCCKRGLTGKQGVILPRDNVNGLCLQPEVVAAVKAKQFHIWAVEHVSQALALLTDMPLISENEEQESLFDKIAERVESMHQQENGSHSLLYRIKARFLSCFD